ncbi:MAG: adenine deaminase [Candidatus Dormibacteraeota bacterium]|nr:adenine deaminase [Candidatus Dormibacteraeota bacterium]
MFTREWLECDVAIAGGTVVGVGSYPAADEVMDVDGAYLTPGFIDAHMHIESSKLMFDEFAAAVLPHGTTTVVADPHELANVLGLRGIRWLLDATQALPLEIFVMAPSCVPASAFESPLGPMGIEEMRELLSHPRVIGVAEMMNFPGVIAADPMELAKSALSEHVDGHAPGVGGRALNAYVAAGIRSDHESVSYQEALEKRRLGMGVMLREASNARNLIDLLPLVREHGPDHCMFCTDDREPNFIAEEGHINQMVRVAVTGGVRPVDALTMATHNAARHHRLWRHGAIAPGYQADLLLFDDLVDFNPTMVLKRGRPVGVIPPIPVPAWARATMNAAPTTARSFVIEGTGGLINVIGVKPSQLQTTREVMRPTVREGCLVADPVRDLVKMAVVERHHATGRIGLGFATNVGLQRGAFASTVAHDAHNIVVLGVDDASMAACVERLGAIGGGLVVVEGGRTIGELALPVAGLMSDQPLDAVHAALTGLERMLLDMGVILPSPFMALSFLALSVIPDLKLTDRGLVDVAGFRLIQLGVD